MSTNSPESTKITEDGWYYISCSSNDATTKTISQIVDSYIENAKSYELYRYVYYLDTVWTQPSTEFKDSSWKQIDLYTNTDATMNPNLGYWINVYNYEAKTS